MEKLRLALLTGVWLLGCGPGQANEGLKELQSALTAPNLAPSKLCFTEPVPNYARTIGRDGAYHRIDFPVSRAVLGGSGGNLQDNQTEVEFRLGAQRAAWDVPKYGPRAQVCAEFLAMNACNLQRACWRQDGGWSVEVKVNEGRESLAECGESGVTVLAQDNGATNRLPALEQGHAYKIAVLHRAPENGLEVSFYRDGSVQRLHAQEFSTLFNGFSGVSTQRLTASVYVRATTADGLWTESLLQGVEGTRLGGAGNYSALRCGHYTAYDAPVGLRQTDAGCSGRKRINLAWDPPPGVSSAEIRGYMLFRDGYQIDPERAPVGRAYQDDFHVVPGQTYTYQVGWKSQAGQLSDLGALSVTAPAACNHPLLADDVLKIGTVLVRFPDTPGPAEPYSLAAARTAVYTHPASFAAYVAETSRGKVAVTGDAHGWIQLPFNISSRCATKNAQGYGISCSFENSVMREIARNAGVPVDHYEMLLFYVNGIGMTGLNIGPSMYFGTHNGAPGTGLIAHEVGHGLGLEHASQQYCLSITPTVPSPSLADLQQGGCTLDPYGDPNDAMGSNFKRYQMMNLLQLGWLKPSETADAVAGQRYWLGKLTSSQYPLRLLRVSAEDPFQYYLEYRDLEGFDGLQSCPSCVPSLPESNHKLQGVVVRVWRNARVANGSLGDVGALIGPSIYMSSKTLGAGQAFRDPYRMLTIRVLQQNSEGAEVEVAYD